MPPVFLSNSVGLYAAIPGLLMFHGLAAATLSTSAFLTVFPILAVAFDVRVFDALAVSFLVDLVNGVVLFLRYGKYIDRKVPVLLFGLGGAVFACLSAIFVGINIIRKNEEFWKQGAGYLDFVFAIGFFVRAFRIRNKTRVAQLLSPGTVQLGEGLALISPLDEDEKSLIERRASRASTLRRSTVGGREGAFSAIRSLRSAERQVSRDNELFSANNLNRRTIQEFDAVEAALAANNGEDSSKVNTDNSDAHSEIRETNRDRKNNYKQSNHSSTSSKLSSDKVIGNKYLDPDEDVDSLASVEERVEKVDDNNKENNSKKALFQSDKKNSLRKSSKFNANEVEKVVADLSEFDAFDAVGSEKGNKEPGYIEPSSSYTLSGLVTGISMENSEKLYRLDLQDKIDVEKGFSSSGVVGHISQKPNGKNITTYTPESMEATKPVMLMSSNSTTNKFQGGPFKNTRITSFYAPYQGSNKTLPKQGQALSQLANKPFQTFKEHMKKGESQSKSRMFKEVEFSKDDNPELPECCNKDRKWLLPLAGGLVISCLSGIIGFGSGNIIAIIWIVNFKWNIIPATAVGSLFSACMMTAVFISFAATEDVISFDNIYGILLIALPCDILSVSLSSYYAQKLYEEVLSAGIGVIFLAIGIGVTVLQFVT